MESRFGISIAILARAELTEVAGGFRDDVVIELENDSAGAFTANGNIELEGTRLV
jgi:hypothetical protein